MSMAFLPDRRIKHAEGMVRRVIDGYLDETGEIECLHGSVRSPYAQKAPEVSSEDGEKLLSNSVFISYAWADWEFVHRLTADLQSAGYSCWMDRVYINGGEHWPRKIQHAIDACAVFIVVLSPDSVTSEWVQNECLYALHMKKLVIPVICNRGFKKMLELMRLQAIDLSRGYEQGLAKLLLALEEAYESVASSSHVCSSL